MIHAAFHWFYCLRIPTAVILVALATVCFLWLNRKFADSRLWKPVLLCALLFWAGMVVMSTVSGRSSEPQAAVPHLVPLHSYAAVLRGETRELLRSNFMNVLLFYPAGLLSGALLPGRWTPWMRGLLAAMLFAAMSAGIELCQYYYALGLAEIDDVIHNTVGAVSGILICGIPVHFEKK